MTQHSQNGEGVEARAREVLALEYEATAPLGRYVAMDIRRGAGDPGAERAIRAMIAFADEARQSLAREPATADVGREAIALIRDWRKLVRLENVKARAGTDLPRDAIDMFQADMYTRWPAWRVDEIIAALSRAAPSSEQTTARIADGYSDAFYDLAKLMGISASTESPSTVWLRQMLPRLQAAFTPSSEPAIAEGERVVSVEDHNAAFDPADEALGGAFREGFREGWIYAQSPDGTDYDDLTEQFGRAVDIEPSEAWSGHRDKYFAMLPLAAIPEIGSTIATTPPTTNDAIPAGMVPGEIPGGMVTTDATMRAALQDIAGAEPIPNDADAFVWCRNVARTALSAPKALAETDEPCGYCGVDPCRCDAADLCQAPGCDNKTDRGICDACNQWVSDQVTALSAAPSAPATAVGEDDQIMIPREPTQAMMDAGLYHSNHDAEWADVNAMWKGMFDAVTLDGGTSVSAAGHTSATRVDGNDIWEALFGIMRGNVPDEMTEEVCSQLAAALSAAPSAPATEAGEEA